MRHVIQQLEVEVKQIENLLRHVTDKKKLAQQRATDLQNEMESHDTNLISLTDQRDKLKAAIEGIKTL